MRRLGWLALVVGVLIVWLLWPTSGPPTVAAHAAFDYGESISRLEQLTKRDTMALHEGCGTTALLHGYRTPRAIVLVHGITNCPLQFLALGQLFYDAGDNVLLPRVPHHGLADRMTKDLAQLRSEEVLELVAECVGMAQGLGDTVVVAGLSTSGVATAWAAQECDGVARAVAIAPAFGPPWGPPWTRPLLAHAALRLPNLFPWWDRKKKANLDGPTQCYPRFSTHALAEGYRLGEQVMRLLAKSPPRTKDLAIVTTGFDEAVDNDRADILEARWRRAGVHVRRYSFPESLHVVHDMIDPLQVGARIDVTYPVLFELIRGER